MSLVSDYDNIDIDEKHDEHFGCERGLIKFKERILGTRDARSVRQKNIDAHTYVSTKSLSSVRRPFYLAATKTRQKIDNRARSEGVY